VVGYALCNDHSGRCRLTEFQGTVAVLWSSRSKASQQHLSELLGTF
jgi:hypothetical protein